MANMHVVKRGLKLVLHQAALQDHLLVSCLGMLTEALQTPFESETQAIAAAVGGWKVHVAFPQSM